MEITLNLTGVEKMCLRAAWDLVTLKTVSLISQGKGNNDPTAMYIGRETAVTGPKHDR